MVRFQNVRPHSRNYTKISNRPHRRQVPASQLKLHTPVSNNKTFNQNKFARSRRPQKLNYSRKSPTVVQRVKPHFYTNNHSCYRSNQCKIQYNCKEPGNLPTTEQQQLCNCFQPQVPPDPKTRRNKVQQLHTRYPHRYNIHKYQWPPGGHLNTQ